MIRLPFLIICSIILIKCRYSAQQTPSKRICFGELEIASFSAEVLFADATLGCSKYGGRLVKIGNAALQDAIRNKIKVKPMYYIGAKEVNGQYIWLVDTTRVPLRGEEGYQHWRHNEPNGAKEQCVAIGVHGTHEWSDVICTPANPRDTFRYSYICQRGSENLLEVSTQGNQVICAVASDGDAIHWTRNSKAIESSVVTNGIYQTFEENRAHLHTANANLSEIGMYECVSKTDTCSAKKSIPVTMEGDPNIIQIHDNKCNSSLLIEWKPAKAAVGFWHRIKVFNNISNVTKYSTPPSTDIQKEKVIGLDFGTNYTVEIQACLKSCETGFKVEMKTTTGGVTEPVSSAYALSDNKGGCRTSWTHNDSDSTFLLQIKCSAAASRENVRKFNLSTIEGIIATSYNFQPFPNRKCEVEIHAKGCGKISGIVNASGTCNTPVETPQSIKPLRVVDGENDASKIVEISKPNEDNGLISCVFIILCYQTCPSKSFTMDDLREANKSNGVNTTGKRNAIALAIPIPSFTEPSRAVKLGNGKLTYCDVHALWHADISSASTNETFQGRNNLNGSGEYIGAVIVTTTPSNKIILLKSSDIVTVVGKREPTSASLISTASMATVASGPGSHISNLPGWVIGLIIGIAVLLILVVAVTLLIRKKRGALRKPPEDQPNVQYIAQENEAAQVPQNPAPAVRPRENQEQANIGRVEEVNPYDNVPPPDQSDGTDIRVSELEAVYNSMRKNGNATFNRQYNNVLQEAARITKPTTAASTFMKKNRYKNILPFDDCRVPLTGGEEGYINASYINGFTSAKKYIATQGPLRSTVADFWMMAMEQNSHVIVMLTKEYDAGKKKCEKYWPDLGKSLNFSNGITVESRQETSCNAYIERILVIRNKTDNSTLVTYQYQFMKWPDHGVPQTTSNLIRMHRIVSNKINELQSQSPIIVHCSAGAGRTGAFLAYDYLLKEVEETGKVDVYRCVVGMRNQRIQMVQNADQYTLVYKLLVEAHIFVDYDYATDELKSKVANLESRDGNRELEREFRELGRMEPMKNSRSVGMEKKHRKFNRGQDAVPYDYSLVSVIMASEETEPPYINASFIESYDSSTKMIAAQGPFDNNSEVFWRVVLDRGVTTIVMLNPLKEGKEERCARYWPEKVGEVSSWGEVGVVCRRDRAIGESISERTLEITRGTETKTVTQFHFTGWKENSCPDDPSEILDVINKMQKHYRSTGEGGTVLIHCNDGIGRTGAFCTIVNLIDRVKWENRIDVFRTVKDLRDGRPNMVKNLDQYHFCYKAIANYLKSFELYANF